MSGAIESDRTLLTRFARSDGDVSRSPAARLVPAGPARSRAASGGNDIRPIRASIGARSKGGYSERVGHDGCLSMGSVVSGGGGRRVWPRRGPATGRRRSHLCAGRADWTGWTGREGRMTQDQARKCRRGSTERGVTRNCPLQGRVFREDVQRIMGI